MFKIGKFSKLVQVSVPTLRYYEQVGLLKPIEVDRFTGYRPVRGKITGTPPSYRGRGM